MRHSVDGTQTLNPRKKASLGQDEVKFSLVAESAPLSVDDHVTRLPVVTVPVSDLELVTQLLLY